MKITRESILEILKKSKKGLPFNSICKIMRAVTARKGDKVSRILKLLQRDELIKKVKSNYLLNEVVKNKKSSADQDFKKILKKYELPAFFSEEVLSEARRVERGAQAEFKKRPKAPGWIITIDSESAKDLDDAVSVEKRGLNYELGVHIADVSWYVKKGSLLDQEAFERATSVYLIDKVVPMFPGELSNELCSLNADTQKLCFSAYITISRKGIVKKVRFERTAVQVNRRFSYKEVAEILDGRKDPDQRKLKLMSQLASVLRESRVRSGSLLFEVPQIKVELDSAGEPVNMGVPERLESEMVIEEFMLCANQQVARFLEEQGSAIFRIHEDPDEEKLQNFYQFASRMGLNIKQPTHVTPMSMQRVLDSIKSNPAAEVLNSLLIRSMQKAVYSTTNPGHFGLAFTTYTHFTSPIRRYPDLIVHRLLAAALAGKKGYGRKMLEKIAMHSSNRERRALEAERDIVSIKGARFMEQYKGQKIEGRITSVVSWGMFIHLLPFGVDGMLHVQEMRDDRYNLDLYGHALVGQRRGRKYAIGDVISVTVRSVNVQKGFVDLSLV